MLKLNTHGLSICAAFGIWKYRSLLFTVIGAKCLHTEHRGHMTQRDKVAVLAWCRHVLWKALMSVDSQSAAQCILA